MYTQKWKSEENKTTDAVHKQNKILDMECVTV